MNANAKKILEISLLVIFFLFIAGFALFQAKGIIFGVKIKNVNITDGATVTENILEIKGNAENAINLTLNGREISVDKDGNFDETIVLLPGYNVIDIKAIDKFGKMDEKVYKLMYKIVNTF